MKIACPIDNLREISQNYATVPLRNTTQFAEVLDIRLGQGARWSLMLVSQRMGMPRRSSLFSRDCD